VLVVDKPVGPSSAAVVHRVRKALRVKEVGHTGTLDPLASGVLPLVIGEATKIAGALQADDKRYDAALELGLSTDSHDVQGKVLARAAWAGVERSAVMAALASLTGTLMQVPPMHAAIKQGGVKLYELAHRGIEVERAAREVVVHSLELLAFAPPTVELRVHCGSGTYVRALIRDLGQLLGCGATMTALRRTRVGDLGLLQAMSLAAIEGGAALTIVAPADALGRLPAWRLDADEARRVRQGQRLKVPESLVDGAVRLLDPGGGLAALGRIEPSAEPGVRKLHFERIFHGAPGQTDG
jgi:tRNA pseudouridine55 synthase